MKISKVEELAKTKFITLNKATCINNTGNSVYWDYISRNNNQKIVTIIAKDSTNHTFLLNRQFRIPMNKFIIEFPKGVIDPGESVENAALRELQEETGYTGEILKIHPEFPTCSYLTSEISALVEVEVDTTNRNPTNLEDSEEISSLWLSQGEFKEKFVDNTPEDCLVEGLVKLYFLGLEN
jgi:ADP-ribose diphosphatase